ncbi:hypothetical protein [Treponema sp.]|uniref:hypothetical protein n=1 Tax=Treponema sp. TaxID=166 RepID=UPI003FD72B44
MKFDKNRIYTAVNAEMKVYKSKRTGIEIKILAKGQFYVIYKVLKGINIGFIGDLSEEELKANWELIKWNAKMK